MSRVPYIQHHALQRRTRQVLSCTRCRRSPACITAVLQGAARIFRSASLQLWVISLEVLQHTVGHNGRSKIWPALVQSALRDLEISRHLARLETWSRLAKPDVAGSHPIPQHALDQSRPDLSTAVMSDQVLYNPQCHYTAAIKHSGKCSTPSKVCCDVCSRFTASCTTQDLAHAPAKTLMSGTLYSLECLCKHFSYPRTCPIVASVSMNGTGGRAARRHHAQTPSSRLF